MTLSISPIKHIRIFFFSCEHFILRKHGWLAGGMILLIQTALYQGRVPVPYDMINTFDETDSCHNIMSGK